MSDNVKCNERLYESVERNTGITKYVKPLNKIHHGVCVWGGERCLLQDPAASTTFWPHNCTLIHTAESGDNNVVSDLKQKLHNNHYSPVNHTTSHFTYPLTGTD